MPTNSVIDVNAAASSTKIRNIAASPTESLEHRKNNVLFLFYGQATDRGRRENRPAKGCLG
jgi:hypothetical protein